MYWHSSSVCRAAKLITMWITSSGNSSTPLLFIFYMYKEEILIHAYSYTEKLPHYHAILQVVHVNPFAQNNREVAYHS